MIDIISAEAAAAIVKDNDTVIVGGNGGTGAPESILVALEQRFLGSGAPRNLTLFHVTGIGAVTEKGLCRLAHRGLVGRVIGGNYGLQLPFMKLIVENEIEAYNFPQGVMSQMCRAMAGKQLGIVTHVGLNTYMDPRLDGGRMNARTTEKSRRGRAARREGMPVLPGAGSHNRDHSGHHRRRRRLCRDGTRGDDARGSFDRAGSA